MTKLERTVLSHVKAMTYEALQHVEQDVQSRSLTREHKKLESLEIRLHKVMRRYGMAIQ